MPTILIVDDEPDLVATLSYVFEQEGWATQVAYDGRTALQLARRVVPDVIVLDLMLPDMSGTEVCRQLRTDESTRSARIMMLSARVDEIDRVVGFEVGADDYVGKPVSTRELVLRIRALVRRTVATDELDERRIGILRIKSSAHQVWVQDQEVPLTALEFRLLETLVARRGRLQSREALLQEVWGHAPGSTTRTVDTHIQRLRKKLGAASSYVETLRGAGYRFRGAVEEGADHAPRAS